ncbi:hypothetical protein K2173_027226 [Erythroxylum novogranatense]|uniref:FAF domain-containing protein n=1 Tax=Erythroxylum novogranatense TaxID=1862640 RepID=A0AAV8U1Q0_9ROSI|nr:hypothetical protein K2173_027226 [Erythroxylum novogranatense]
MMMMSFCKKSVNSFLGLASPIVIMDGHDSNNHGEPSSVCSAIPGGGGIGLMTVTEDTHKTPDVLESATVNKNKVDPGGIGFIDDIGGGVDGLMSCTESLGFERRGDDEIKLCSRETIFSTTKKVAQWRKDGGNGGRLREVKKFPPPLSSLNRNGQPSFFLRPARKDGRLELTEVRIDRPDILRASREHGRLRLQLIRDQNFDNIVNDDDEEEEVVEPRVGDNQELEQEQETLKLNEEQQQEEETNTSEKIRGGEEEKWMLPVLNGECIRWCHDLATHHQHDLNVWRSQHCVTTRQKEEGMVDASQPKLKGWIYLH